MDRGRGCGWFGNVDHHMLGNGFYSMAVNQFKINKC